MGTRSRQMRSRRSRQMRRKRNKYRMDPPSYGEDFPPPYPSQQQMEIYRTQIAQYVNEITRLQNRIGSLTDLLDRTRTTDDAAINDLQQENLRLRQRYIRLTILNQQQQTQNQQLQTQNQQQQTQNQQLQSRLASVQRERNTYRDEANYFRRRLVHNMEQNQDDRLQESSPPNEERRFERQHPSITEFVDYDSEEPSSPPEFVRQDGVTEDDYDF